MPTILLTGATGYIGSHTWIALKQAGFDVLGVDNFANSSPVVLERLTTLLGEQPVFEEADVNDTARMEDIIARHGVSAVVHFAAHKAVGESTQKPLEYFRNNLGGLVSVATAMSNQGVKALVFSSSATVYGQPERLPITEDCALSTTNPYGMTKLLGELVPDIQRTAIERNGRTWLVGHDAWRAALQAVFDAQEKGTLTLPLDGNGYLYATLMRMADRQEAAQERDTEAARKHGTTAATVTVKGQALAIGDALDKVFPTKDPELAKLDADSRKAAPMPAHIRDQIAALRKGGAKPNDSTVEKGNDHE